MGCKQGFGPDLVVQMLDNRPGEAQAIERAGATTDFVQHDQASRGGIVENIGRLAHFYHERGLPARQIITGPDASEYTVDQVNPGLCCWDKRAGMSKQSQ